MKNKGVFITFEGCEGVGKSTQVELLKKYFNDNNTDCLFLREPGGAKISEKIRALILDIDNKEMTKECEALLYSAARAQLVGQIIKPALEKGTIVVCDRFIDSTYAYQGFARGLGSNYVSKLNQAACNGILPDVTIFLDLDPKSAFLRKGGADEGDRLEQESIDFHQKVYEGYVEACNEFPDRLVRISAKSDIATIHNDIISVLKNRGYID